MTGPVPRFPPTPPPLEWDQLTLYAATVFLEAEGEPNEGKVAVAWVMAILRPGEAGHLSVRGRGVQLVRWAPWAYQVAIRARSSSVMPVRLPRGM